VSCNKEYHKVEELASIYFSIIGPSREKWGRGIFPVPHSGNGKNTKGSSFSV
jgi:hypothetical protein